MHISFKQILVKWYWGNLLYFIMYKIEVLILSMMSWIINIFRVKLEKIEIMYQFKDWDC
jgi:hypothetical protein